MRSPSGSRRALIALAPLLAYAGLTLLLFWPLLPQLGTGLHDRSDTTLNTWILAWQAHILLAIRSPSSPRRSSTRCATPWRCPDPVAGRADRRPASAATGNPVLIYNLLFLAAFPLAGYSAYLLAFWVAGSG